MKISTLLMRRSAALSAAGLLAFPAASTHAARCDYVIQSEWNTGFVAAVRITNDSTAPINGWAVNWAYSDGSSRTGGWNANFSGTNPYSASGVGWNDRINPGQSIEFGVQGNKGVANSPAQRPTVNGAVCSPVINSSSSVAISSKSSSSIPASSTPASSIASSTPASRSASSSSAMPVSSRASSSAGLSSSHFSSSSASSGTSSSAAPNTPPVPVLNLTTHGMTVFIDGSESSDAEGEIVYHKISFGDEQSILSPQAWHTYTQPGDYTVTLEVRDNRALTVIKTQQIHVEPTPGNKAPIAMLTAVRERSSIIAHATASFDPEGQPLTYEWQFLNGEVVAGDARTSFTDCAPGDTISRTGRVTVTVSDGELKDTRQVFASGPCNTVIDVLPAPQFTYRINGSKVTVDGRASRDTTGLSWDFGDGSPRVTGVVAEHNYAAPGSYNIELNASGPSLFSNRISQSVVVDFAPSSQSASSRSSSSRSVSSLGLPSSRSSSSAPVPSSSASSYNRNHYDAHRATTAPVIDGTLDAVWEAAAWAPIDVFWLGTQANPGAQDYSGRYKALWDENYLYLIFDITDDRLFDGTRDALDRYWEDDTVELFIDENRNGGQHGYNTSAWAYHLSTYGDVVDYTTSGPKLLNDHIDMRLVSMGDKHRWEMRVRIYGEDYADWKTNVPLKLAVGKLMGFSATYIDNDGSAQRESMMGSVDTAGHKNNQGYLDASVFGSLRLVE
ncbi:MAG TPA: sugar-binding protein [Cellvibrio sp.]|nr:sugar-binding protein [Cellvibrio sp.]